MGKKRKSRVVRAAYGIMRSSGGVVGASCSLARGVGRSIGASYRILTGGTSKIITLFSRATKRSTQKGQSLTVREQIRSVVIEELTRLVGKEIELTGTKLEGRLQVMAETILALQDKISRLGARGPITEANIWEAVRSLEAAESLTNAERAILVNVFRQNIALQKPELVGAAID